MSEFLSAKDKVEFFKVELVELLKKYDVELRIEYFRKGYSTDEKIVANFNRDENLAKISNDGIIPDWVIGSYLSGDCI